MFDPKHVADLVTFARGLLALGLIWLGWSQGSDGLGLAVYLMLVDWTGDVLDGALARRSPDRDQTWIGDHDLEVDITVSVGLVGYMLLAGYMDWRTAAGYLLVWILIFWHWGYIRSLGMLVQAPIYFWFIFLAISEPPYTGWLIIAWIAIILVITWPRFPREVVPGFLENILGISKE
jgi:cardiolipin synthase